MSNWAISNLCAVPYFIDTVADRCWHAWWTDGVVSHDEYRGWVQATLESETIPACFVAHHGDIFSGCVSLIVNDMELRPQYTPWIAALWVEETARRQGIAAALIDAARHYANGCGHDCVYLCATPDNTPYYLKRGFTQIEADVDGMNVFEMKIKKDC
jgi:GNAT superfamily N-acetyltransferase